MFQWGVFQLTPVCLNPQFKACSTIFWRADKKTFGVSPQFSLPQLVWTPLLVFFLAKSYIKDVMAVVRMRWLFTKRSLFTHFCLEECEWGSSPRKAADFCVNRIGQDLHRFLCEQDWEGLAQLWPLLWLFPFLAPWCHCIQNLLGKRCSVKGFEKGTILFLQFVSPPCVWKSLSCFWKPHLLLFYRACNRARW